MSEPIEWVYQAGTGCAYCKDGLCQRMNQLMEDGYSQRKAAKVMEVEAEGRWTANNIRQLFIKWTGQHIDQKDKTPKQKEVTPEQDKDYSMAMKYARMAEMDLKGIHTGHHDWEEAFDYIIKWSQNRKNELKGL